MANKKTNTQSKAGGASPPVAPQAQPQAQPQPKLHPQVQAEVQAQKERASSTEKRSFGVKKDKTLYILMSGNQVFDDVVYIDAFLGKGLKFYNGVARIEDPDQWGGFETIKRVLANYTAHDLYVSDYSIQSRKKE